MSSGLEKETGVDRGSRHRMLHGEIQKSFFTRDMTITQNFSGRFFVVVVFFKLLRLITQKHVYIYCTEDVIRKMENEAMKSECA